MSLCEAEIGKVTETIVLLLICTLLATGESTRRRENLSPTVPVQYLRLTPITSNLIDNGG